MYLLLLRFSLILHNFLQQTLPSLFPFFLQYGLIFLIILLLFLLLIYQILEQIFGVYNRLSSVQIFNVLQGFHQLHFSFRIIRLVLQILHGILFLFIHFQPLQIFFSLLGIFNGLIISSTACLYDIIVILGVCFECYFSIAIGTLEIKPKDLDAQIDLLIAYFHTHIEFRPKIEIIGTGITSQRHRQHISNHHQFVFSPSPLHDALVVEVFREILNQNFTLRHTVLLCLFKKYKSIQ